MNRLRFVLYGIDLVCIDHLNGTFYNKTIITVKRAIKSHFKLMSSYFLQFNNIFKSKKKNLS